MAWEQSLEAFAFRRGSSHTGALAAGVAVTLPAVGVAAVSSTVALVVSGFFAKYAYDLIVKSDKIQNEIPKLITHEVSLAVCATVNAVALGILFGLGSAPIGLIAAGGFLGVNVYGSGWVFIAAMMGEL